MTVSLPPDLEGFIEQELAGERYKSREELLAEAVRLLRDHKGEASQEPDWFEQALEQFRAIVGLPGGWDSNDAMAPDPKLVQIAATLLYRLARSPGAAQPHINPTRRGGVQFEWEAGSRSLEVEVIGENCAAYFFQDDAEGIEEEGQVSPREPLDILTGYVQRVASRR